MEIIKNKLDKMESLYLEQWRKLSEIANNGNLDLLIKQTEALKKTYAKIVTLEVLYSEYADTTSTEESVLPISDVSKSLPVRYCQQCGEPLRRKKHKTWCEHYESNAC